MRWLKLLKLLPRVNGATQSLQVKGWYLSKTIWANLLTLVGSVGYAISGDDALTLSPEEISSLSVAAVAIGNIVLRILTRKPVGMRSLPCPAEYGQIKTGEHQDAV